MSATIEKRLALLREALKTVHANAFYTTLTDAHLSEYIADSDQFLTFLTGFTGSDAELLLTEDRAYLWTDSRYWEQAERELAGTGIQVMRSGDKTVPSVKTFVGTLKNESSKSIFLAIDDLRTDVKTFQSLKDVADGMVPVDDAWINAIWKERPERLFHPLYIHHASSVSAHDKLLRLQKHLGKSEAGDEAVLLLTRLDDIAWLTNLRGSDIAFNPIFLSWALISQEKATLFVNEKVLSPEVTRHLCEAGWATAPYETIFNSLRELCDQKRPVLAKPTDLNARIHSLLGDCYVAYRQPVPLWKAVKTPQEIEGLKAVMKADGAAIEAFIEELKERLAKGERLTENDAVDILHAKRAAIPGFIGESFGTIAAVNGNAAMAHYEPKPGAGAPIIPPCVLLVDSGAHYDRGTTDTTRVWFLGNPADFPEEDLKELKRDYTAVYRGMHALMNATFKPGTIGKELDPIAKAPIHAIGADFGHGTGHGIGLTLNVHETPPNISVRDREGTITPFEPGMIVSDEPGIYRPGRWGIRIENMLLCVQKDDDLLGFESLTQCAIDETLLE